LHLSDKDDWSAFKADRLKPESKIGEINKLIPDFGRLYGFFSARFAHIRANYREPQWLVPYDSIDEPLKANLLFLNLSIWLRYVVAELVFFDMAKPMCWEHIGHGAYLYKPTPEGMEWQRRLLRSVAVEEPRQSDGS